MAYTLVLFLHSWSRWALLLLGAAALVSFVRAWLGEGLRGKGGLGIAYTAVFDLQVLGGLLLYFVLSPVAEAARHTPGAMKDPILRFWQVEHLAGMLLAAVVLHLGRVFAKQADTPQGRARGHALAVLISLVVVLASIPWPGTPYGRLLFRPWNS